MYTVLLVAHTILVLFLIVMVIIQRPTSDGLGGLGGGGGNQFMTGRSAANFMTRTTAILAAAFMLTSVVLAVIANRMTSGSILDEVPVEETVPVNPTVPLEQSVPQPEPDAAPKAAPSVPKPE